MTRIISIADDPTREDYAVFALVSFYGGTDVVEWADAKRDEAGGYVTIIAEVRDNPMWAGTEAEWLDSVRERVAACTSTT